MKFNEDNRKVFHLGNENQRKKCSNGDTWFGNNDTCKSMLE